MTLTCPHCAKNISISPEELAISNAVVVCPQCLTEFVAQGVDLPSVSSTRHQTDDHPDQVQDNHGTHAERFCYGCGQELPLHDGLRFCPFCGIPLLANQLSRQHKPEHEQLENGGTTRSTASATSSTNNSATRQAQTKTDKNTKASSNAYRYVPKVFSKELRPEPPSLRFKLFAYSIITVLVAIFVVIVYLGNKI